MIIIARKIVEPKYPYIRLLLKVMEIVGFSILWNGWFKKKSSADDEYHGGLIRSEIIEPNQFKHILVFYDSRIRSEVFFSSNLMNVLICLHFLELHSLNYSLQSTDFYIN